MEWHGKIELIYERRGAKTLASRAYHCSPFKLQRSFYPEGEDTCHSTILHTAGGIVGGDRLSQELRLGSETRALVTTATAGKVYRSNGKPARQNIAIALEPGAVLEWLPQEAILFEGADFAQDLRVDLAPGAAYLGWEIARFGRSARGEKFLHGRWRSRWEIWQQGTPLWIDRQQLVGSEATWFGSHALAESPVLGTLVCIGEPIPSSLLDLARELAPSTGEFGATSTQAQGILCRYRGHSIAESRGWFISVWEQLRSHLWQRPLHLPRVWPLELKNASSVSQPERSRVLKP